jgi:hypothetical protein
LNKKRRNRVSISVSVAAAALAFAGASFAPAAFARDRDSGPASEMASQLLPIRGGGDRQIAAARQADLTVSKAERVLVEIYVSGPADAAAAKLRKAGVSVRASADEPLPVVEGWVDATDLTSVAAMGVTTALRPVMGG